jgi:hypothetical protein
MKVSDILSQTPMFESSQLNEDTSPEDITSRFGKDAVITYVTDVKLLGGKKNEMLGRVSKITRDLPVVIAGPGDYEKRKQQTDPSFVSKPRVWGAYNDKGLIEHKGELYVQFYATGPGRSEYLLDGQPIAKEDIVGFQPSPPPAADEPRITKLRNIVRIQ